MSHQNLYVTAWKGEASLAKAFWLVHALTTFVLAAIITIIIHYLNPELAITAPTGKIQSIVYSIVCPYQIYAAIAVWKCGADAKTLWRIISRVLVVLAVFSCLLHIFWLIAS